VTLLSISCLVFSRHSPHDRPGRTDGSGHHLIIESPAHANPGGVKLPASNLAVITGERCKTAVSSAWGFGEYSPRRPWPCYRCWFDHQSAVFARKAAFSAAQQRENAGVIAGPLRVRCVGQLFFLHRVMLIERRSLRDSRPDSAPTLAG